MTTQLSVRFPTLVDVQKRTDPSGKMLPIVEALQQRNTFLQSLMWKEGNLDVGHMVSARNALPSVEWVVLNRGVLPTKDNVDNYTEQCGILEGLSSIDTRVAKLNGNAAAYRASQDDGFLAAMSNTLESAFFYASTKTDPEQILGLTPRLNSLTGAYSNQVIAGGSNDTDNSSIWLIGWGENSVYGISPRGQASGLQMEDKGEVRTEDSNGRVLYKYETLFRWNCGLCVEDYRNVVRICNIEISDLTANAGSGDDLIDLMIQAYYQIYDPKSVRLAWYCNRTLAAFLHRQALKATSSSTLSVQPASMIGAPGFAGQPITSCLGAPIYVSDALTTTEALVS